MIYFPKRRWLMKSSLWSCDRPENIFTDVIRNNKWHHHSPFLLSRHSDDMLNRTAGSSRPVVFCKKGVLRNFIKLTGKRLWQSLFINKVAGLRPATLLKKRLWQRRFPVSFVKFLRIPSLQNTSRRLLLDLFESFWISNWCKCH